jgi:hypothetical protein
MIPVSAERRMLLLVVLVPLDSYVLQYLIANITSVSAWVKFVFDDLRLS